MYVMVPGYWSEVSGSWSLYKELDDFKLNKYLVMFSCEFI